MNTCDKCSTLLQVLERNANGKRGIIFIKNGQEDTHLTYRDLFIRSKELVSRYIDFGINPGDEIVIQVEDNEFFLISFWAALLYGCPAVPLTLAGKSENANKFFRIWAQLKKPYLVTDEKNFDDILSFKSDEYARLIDQINQRVILKNAAYSSNDYQPFSWGHLNEDSLAYVQFSSGSTGNPKGVILTHANLMANTNDMISRGGMSRHDTILSWLPLTHDMGLIAVHLTALVAEIDQVLMDTSLFVRRPTLWLQKSSEYRASILFSPNFGYYFLVANLGVNMFNWDLSSVRLIFNGAEPISIDVCLQFVQILGKYGLADNVIFAGYGLAEASVAVSLPKPGMALVVCQVERDSLTPGKGIVVSSTGLKFVSVGFPLEHCQIRISFGRSVLGENVVGDIEIKGRNVTKGYYLNNQASDELFSNDGWLKTGDLGFFRDGTLYVTGRKKNIIIINGQNFYPHDIEALCCQNSNVELGQVAACSIKFEHDEGVVVFIASPLAIAPFVAVQDDIASRLNTGLGIQSRHIIRVRKIPKTTSGKIQHFKLVEQFENGVFNGFLEKVAEYRDAVLREMSVRERLLKLSKEIFGPDFDPEGTLLLQGINSLQIIRFTILIQQRFDVSLSAADVFEFDSIKSLSFKINDLLNDAKLDIVSDLQFSPHTVSAPQKRLWLWDQMYPGHTALTLSSAQVLHGKVNTGALQSAFEAIVLRHPSLRTSFICGEDGPKIQIHSPLDISSYFLFEDIAHNSISRNQIASIIAEKNTESFNVETGPLFKINLIKFGLEEHLLIIRVHHMVFDGWSFRNLVTEVTNLYQYFLLPGNIALTLPIIDYNPSEAWSHRSSFQQDVSLAKKYWYLELQNMPVPITTALVKQQKSKLQRPSFKSKVFEIPRAKLENIKKVATDLGASVFMFLLTCLKTLLYKYTQENELVIYTTSFGRHQQSTENLIGYFAQTIMVRTKVSGAETFVNYLSTVREKIVNGFRHSSFTFDDAIENLRHDTEATYSEIFDVLVVYQNFEYDFRLGSLGHEIKVEPIENDIINSLVRLQFEFTERPDNIILKLAYEENSFDSFVVNQLSEHFFYLLDEILINYNRTLSELNFFSGPEKREILQFSNIDFNSIIFNDSVIDKFDDQAKKDPDAIAVVWGYGKITYGELQAHANKLANHLKELKVKRQDKIGIYLTRSVAQIVAVLAILKLEAVFVPLDCDHSTNRVKIMIDDCNPRLIVTNSQSISTSPIDFSRLLFLDQIDFSVSTKASFNQDRSDDSEALAYIMYTSGTSGKPKAVPIRSFSLNCYIRNFVEYFSLTKLDVVAQQSSICFDTYIEEIFPILCVGGTIVGIVDGPRDVLRMKETIDAFNVTVLSTTPAVLVEFDRLCTHSSSLRLVVSGGETLRQETIPNLFLTSEIYNTYGPTECTVCSTFHRVTLGSKGNIIGRPLSTTCVLVLNNGQLTPIGINGEIVIGGKGIATGYLNDPEITSDRFVSNILGVESLFYKTGDLAKWTPDGTLEYVGRNDDQIKIRGHRVEPEEVNRTLMKCSVVQESIVIGQINSMNKMMLVAYLIFRHSTDLNEVKTFLLDKLPSYMIPSQWFTVDKWPLTISGKIDKLSLQRQYSRTNDIVKPSTEFEQRLLDIWTSVLNTPVSINESLFSQGGDSMTVIKIVAKSREYGFNFSAKDVFRYDSIDVLAKHLSESANNIILEKRISLVSRNEGSNGPFQNVPDTDDEDIIKI